MGLCDQWKLAAMICSKQLRTIIQLRIGDEILMHHGMACMIRDSNVDLDDIPRICINASINLNSKG
jgi:hypothetical protein